MCIYFNVIFTLFFFSCNCRVTFEARNLVYPGDRILEINGSPANSLPPKEVRSCIVFVQNGGIFSG